MNPLSPFFESIEYGQHRIIWQDHEVHLFKQSWGELAISSQGAQVLHFCPAEQSPWLWLSPTPKPPGQAIRGGIPLCWPWFGDHPCDAQQPAHGPARISVWHFDKIDCQDDRACFKLSPDQPLHSGLDVSLVVEVSNNNLKLELFSHNRGSAEHSISQALHSYFLISDLSDIGVQGLEQCPNYNKLSDQYQDPSAIMLRPAIDRVYQHQGVINLQDQQFDREFIIEKQHSQSSVVWNSGDEKLPVDIPAAEQNEYLCIEAANTHHYDPIVLAPGQSHKLCASYYTAA